MFVLASNHFRKCFSVNAGVWLCMENKFSGSYFQLTVCFSWLDSEIGFSQNFHFKPFPNSCAERERERERERAQITPQTKLQSDDHRLSSSPTTPAPTYTAPHQRRSTPAPIKQRSTPTPLDLVSAARSRLRLHCAISPLDRTQSPLSLPSSLNLTGFDDFFSGFCFFCVSILRNDINICLAAEKM